MVEARLREYAALRMDDGRWIQEDYYNGFCVRATGIKDKILNPAILLKVKTRLQDIDNLPVVLDGVLGQMTCEAIAAQTGAGMLQDHAQTNHWVEERKVTQLRNN
jgi:hypothetical protein